MIKKYVVSKPFCPRRHSTAMIAGRNGFSVWERRTMRSYDEAFVFYIAAMFTFRPQSLKEKYTKCSFER